MDAKKIIIGFLFLLTSSLFANDYVLVTDLDDTLKVTNGKHTGSMIGNALFRRKVFAGMPTLFDEIKAAGVERSYLLSASPSLLMWSVKRLLRKHRLWFNGIYLSRTRDLFRKREYKLSRLERIIGRTKGKLILFGDNQSIDHEIYTEIKKRHPDRVAKIYIHRVQPTPIPKTVFEYITPLEVALDLKGILTEEQVYNVAKAMENNRKFRRLIPKFAVCPTEPWIAKAYSDLAYVTALENRVNTACKNRQD